VCRLSPVYHIHIRVYMRSQQNAAYSSSLERERGASRGGSFCGGVDSLCGANSTRHDESGLALDLILYLHLLGGILFNGFFFVARRTSQGMV